MLSPNEQGFFPHTPATSTLNKEGLGNIFARHSRHGFRIGHLGDFNDLTLMATLSGVKKGLTNTDNHHKSGDAKAAMDYLIETME